MWLLLEKMTIAGQAGSDVGVGFVDLIAIVVVELAGFAVAAEVVVASVPAVVGVVVAVSAGLAVFAFLAVSAVVRAVGCAVASVFQLAVVVLAEEVEVVVVVAAVGVVGSGVV